VDQGPGACPLILFYERFEEFKLRGICVAFEKRWYWSDTAIESEIVTI